MKKHIDDLTNKELDRLCAEVQGFEKVASGNDIETELWKETVTTEDEEETITTFRYIPTSQTEQGMAQCFQLMVKFELSVAVGYMGECLVEYKDKQGLTAYIRLKDSQIAICRAVVMSKYGEEVEV